MIKRIKMGILVAPLLLGLIVYVIFAQSATWLSISSPNKTYTVELMGNKSRSVVPLTDQKVQFRLYKRGQPVVKAAPLISFDWFDSGFSKTYPEHKWVSESILQFSSNIVESENSLDSLVISNNTNKTVKYLKIRVLDMFLIFDIEPNSSIKLTVPHYRWQSWVVGEGEFEDGERISGNGVNFFHKDKLKEPLRYCISINNNVLRIESPLIEGWNSDNPKIPKAVNCNS